MNAPVTPSRPHATFRELRSDRLLVRRFRDDDAETFAAYRSDPDVARYQSWEPPCPVAAAHRFITAMHDEHPDTPGGWFQFALEERTTGVHVGDVAALVDGDDPRLVTIGVTLAREWQGRGLATEAVRTLLGYLFEERGKHRVIADCDPRNLAVVALLKRLGMRREAHHVQSHWDGVGWSDEYVYAMLEQEWRLSSVGRVVS